ncbi:protein kinase C zeta type-like isoform X1 [Oncorhynchus tshawytscha]|uniref:protein kinase C zeta type-like isoform X1 n=1 Tax=Oncorhynchus tshawytscha TaxID=74940 RepID=UPI000D09DB4E|nr:protein kinase C zeta type-like isoform X1 [Oncorhynchus tshawytscha]XP_029478566.1 protein kinase C zeta type isoform X1 [Oncorhynchus nerka]
MHSNYGSMMDLGSDYVKIKAHYSGDMLITDLAATVTYMGLCEEVRVMCSLAQQQPITLKWIDDEGDPCTISSQMELQEAFRIYSRNRNSGLLLHVFPSIPVKPGMPCPGEDQSIYRRGARRWRKLYRVNGHLFQAKRFNRKAYCGHCSERIWGLGRQGYKCINCKLLVHKRCHTLVPLTCQRHMEPVMPSQEPPLDEKSEEVDLLPQDTEDTDGIPFLPHNCKMDKVEEDSEDIKAVVDGIEGIKISQGLALGLGDFDLIRVIGRGSYAKVLLVRLKKNEQIYAMKVVKKELVHDDEDIDWVQTEKHVFEQASTNPFLVGLHSCFQTESRLFLVIEYVNGGDLMFHMQRQRKLPEEHARFYAAEICIALNFLHEKGILYRDLKLDNVLLDHEGHIKLTDYGMCKEGIRPGDTTSTFCGTPNYIAPEILRGEDYGFSVDWWALGVLMFEMMAGRSPFDIITDNPDMNTEEYLFQVILEKPIRIPRSLSVKAASVLKGFLNKDPKERLGCQVQTGFSDIKSHTFFRSIDWDQLEKKQMAPPFKPQIADDYGLENFDTQFTNEPVQLTPDDEDVIKRIDQSEFEGFEYINPLLLSAEESV